MSFFWVLRPRRWTCAAWCVHHWMDYGVRRLQLHRRWQRARTPDSRRGLRHRRGRPGQRRWSPRRVRAGTAPGRLAAG